MGEMETPPMGGRPRSMLSLLVTIGAHAGFDAAGDGCCAATATRRCCFWARCCSSADAVRGLHGQFSAL